MTSKYIGREMDNRLLGRGALCC